MKYIWIILKILSPLSPIITFALSDVFGEIKCQTDVFNCLSNHPNRYASLLIMYLAVFYIFNGIFFGFYYAIAKEKTNKDNFFKYLGIATSTLYIPFALFSTIGVFMGPSRELISFNYYYLSFAILPIWLISYFKTSKLLLNQTVSFGLIKSITYLFFSLLRDGGSTILVPFLMSYMVEKSLFL